MKATLTPLKHLLADAREKRYEAGQIILYESDPVGEALMLTSGIVKVYEIDDKGQEKILQIIKAPAILPLCCLLDTPSLTSWYYVSLGYITLSTFKLSSLRKQMKICPSPNLYIINWLAAENHELMVRLNGMNKTETKDKVVSILKFLDVYYTEAERHGWRQVEFPITHQFIADMAGLARESVSIQMNQLQKGKVIRTRRPFTELHHGKLARL